MDIGSVIKERRLFMHLTQEELAAKLNVSPQAISRWECGLSYPDIAMVPLLTETMGISADKLLGCEKTPCNEVSLQAATKAADTSNILNQSQIDSIFNSFEPSSDGAQKKVLIVDDAAFMRVLLKDMLTKRGHSVVAEAQDGQSALKYLEAETCDVCILDIAMPGMNGLEVLEQIKKRFPLVKVIMLSALCTEDNVKKALELSADAFVAKPFQASSLLDRI